MAKKAVDINKSPTNNSGLEVIKIAVSKDELAYFKDTLSLLTKLTNNNRPVLNQEDTTIHGFCKIALHFICNTYRDNLFTDTNLVKKMTSNDTLREFITFRSKHMGYPVEQQVAELQSMGVLSKKVG